MTTNSSDGVSKLDYSSDKHHKSRGLAQLVDSEVKDQSSEPNSGFLGSLRHRILVESSKFISKMTRNIGSFIVKTIFKSKVPEVSLGDNNESLRNPSDSHFSGGNANSNGDRSFPNTLNSQHITVESSNLSEDKMSKSSSEFQDTSISHSSPLIIKQPNQPFGKIHHQIPLHHANTIDLPSLNALRKSKKRLRMAEIFNNTKESAARTNTGFSMPPSVLLSGAPPLYDFDAQANNSNLKRNSRLEYESKTANRGPLPPGYGQSLLKYASINDSKPPGGFQHIPLERFTTIEPEFGAFRTSIEYRLERKSLEQDGMTIHSLDEDSAEFLSKLGLSSKLDADESANIVELCLRKLSKKAKMAHGGNFHPNMYFKFISECISLF